MTQQSDHPGDQAAAELIRDLDRLDEQLSIRTYTTTSPILVKAVQLTEDADWEEVAKWCGGDLMSLGINRSGEHIRGLVVPPGEDGEPTFPARLNDWVIQGVTGHYFWRSPEEFAATYTPATDEQQGQQERYDDLEARFIDILVPLAALLRVPAVIPDPEAVEGGEDPENPPQQWNLDGIEDALARQRPQVFRPGDPEPGPEVTLVMGRDKCNQRHLWRRRGIPGLRPTRWAGEALAEWSRIFDFTPVLVEVTLPDYDAAVAADEKAGLVERTGGAE